MSEAEEYQKQATAAFEAQRPRWEFKGIVATTHVALFQTVTTWSVVLVEANEVVASGQAPNSEVGRQIADDVAQAYHDRYVAAGSSI